MREDGMDAHPINSMVSWLGGEARSIPAREKDRMERSMSELNDLKARIAAGEYRLDAHAIADAMFGRADREIEAQRLEVLEAREVDGPAGGVDQF
jgi:hypothetical protein